MNPTFPPISPLNPDVIGTTGATSKPIQPYNPGFSNNTRFRPAGGNNGFNNGNANNFNGGYTHQTPNPRINYPVINNDINVT